MSESKKILDKVTGSIKSNAKKAAQSSADALETAKLAQKLQRVLNSIKRIITFIKAFWIPIVIIILLIWVVIPSVKAYASTVGSTPHFYCALNAPDPVKNSELYQRYCGKKSKGGNGDLVEAALSLVDECNQTLSQAAAGGKWEEYRKIYDETGTYLTDGHYDNCSGFVACAIRWALTTNIDTNDPDMWLTQERGMNNSNWEEVDESNLEPGDVFVSDRGGSSGEAHTFIYVGKEAVHEKFPDAPEDHDSVGAAWQCYMPRTCSKEAEKGDKPKWHVFRWIGEADTEFKDLSL